MAYLKKYWPVILSLIFFIAAFGFLLYIALTGTFEVSNEIIVVLLTAILSGFGWIIKSEYDKRREINRREHEVKIEQDRLTFETRRQSYEGIVQPFIDAMVEGPDNIDEDNLKNQFMRAGFKLLIYGSDDIIQAFNNYRQLGLQQPPNQIALLVEFARFLINIRKSTGFPGTTLTIEEVLRTFIIDYDNYSQQIQDYIRENP